MEKELKTLNDLKVNLQKEIIIDYKTKEIHFPCGINVVSYDKLKAEAIKWVKEIKNKKIDRSSYIKGFDAGQINWIKHFFNITEEDLKNEKRT